MSKPDPAVGRGFLKLGLGEAVARLVSFGATVYLAHRLGPGVYGMIVVAMTIIAYVARVSDCGVDLLGVHDVAHEPSRLPELLPSYMGARLLVAGLMILLVVGTGLAAFPPLEGAILAVYAFQLAPMALSPKWALLGLEQAGRVSISRTIAELTTALLIIGLVRGATQATTVPLAAILGEALGAYVLLRALPRIGVTLRGLLHVGTVLQLYRRSWPLVLNAILGLVIFNSDFFFLRILRDSTTVGYYAAAYALVSFMLNVGNSYQMTLMPAVARAMSDPAREKTLYQSAIAQVSAGVFPVALGGCLIAPRLIPTVFGAAYLPSILPLQILLWAIPVALLRNVAQGVMIAHGRQGQMLQTSLAAAGSNMLLNLLLIPSLGMMGAAMVTVLTESVRTFPMLRMLARSGLPFAPPVRFWRTLLSGAVMTGTVLLLPVDSVWAAIPAGGIAYVGTLTLSGGIRFYRRRLPELLV